MASYGSIWIIWRFIIYSNFIIIIKKMEPYVLFLIFVLVIVILIAIIIDKIDKKNRNGKINKDENSDGERDFVENKREKMEEFQRISTQAISYK